MSELQWRKKHSRQLWRGEFFDVWQYNNWHRRTTKLTEHGHAKPATKCHIIITNQQLIALNTETAQRPFCTPHVDDLTHDIWHRWVWWPISEEVVQEQFKVTNDNKLTHPTFFDAAGLWYLQVTPHCHSESTNWTGHLMCNMETPQNLPSSHLLPSRYQLFDSFVHHVQLLCTLCTVV